MDVKLFKIRVYTEDGSRYFYAFYIKSDSGVVTRIRTNSYTKKDGTKIDNYTILVCIAKEIKDLDEIKYE